MILILSSLLDYIVLLLPFQPTNKAWQLNITAQLVDRGIIPMVGIAFVITAYWMTTAEGAPTLGRPIWQSLRFWAFGLASLLGLIFLLLVPLHLLNISGQQDLALKQIDQGASQAEAQLENRLQQLKTLINSDQPITQLDQAIKSGQYTGQQLDELQRRKDQLLKLKQDPKALNQQYEDAQTQLRGRKLEVEQQAKQQALQSGIRVGVSSLLLAIGYIAIGWTGLINIMNSQGVRRKPKMR